MKKSEIVEMGVVGTVLLYTPSKTRWGRLVKVDSLESKGSPIGTSITCVTGPSISLVKSKKDYDAVEWPLTHVSRVTGKRKSAVKACSLRYLSRSNLKEHMANLASIKAENKRLADLRERIEKAGDALRGAGYEVSQGGDHLRIYDVEVAERLAVVASIPAQDTKEKSDD